MLIVGALLCVAGRASSARAVTPADRSEVVLVLDFSGSILKDKANRDRFAAALDQIADRIDETSSDLVAGDATVSILQFATKAADYSGCVDLSLKDSPRAVARFADCLRNLGKAYRTGLDPRLARIIGVGTNYVAAMERAARHIPADAGRPALILFTDGQHDVPGVPVSSVQPARDRLFANRSPFALLPVGMGLNATERDALERGLVRLRIIRDMSPCASGAVFDWPQVVFESPGEAGNAVAVALQDVTCTFTVASTPTPTPTPAQTPGAVQGVGLTPGDAMIKVTWVAPAARSAPIEDYRVRCRTDNGEWTESEEGVSLETSAVVARLTNGAAYQCEVAAVNSTSEGAWTAATTTATPIARPAAPGKPFLQALDRGVRIWLPAEAASQVSDYRYECSGDHGGTWSTRSDVASSTNAMAEIGSLTNGVDYVCRAFAANASGVSNPSALSDAFRPCGSLLECQPALRPGLGLLGLLLVGGLLAAVLVLYRKRTREYVVAVVDGVHTANLGYGSTLGIGFVRSGPSGPVTGIVGDRRPNADVRIRYRGGGRFVVTDGVDRHTTTAGEGVVITDSWGVRHEVVVRAFGTRTAGTRVMH
jgi:hypothetical protein